MSNSAFSNSLGKLLSTTVGRDKACRLVQYLMRFLAEGVRAKAEGKALKAESVRTAVRMENLGSSMAATRKVLRFGRPIGIIMNIVKTLREIAEGKVTDVPGAILKVLGDVCLVLFFLFDHYMYLERIGLANNPSRRATADYLSNLFWLLECVFGILKNTSEYAELLQTCSKAELTKRRDELAVDTLRNALDIPVAIGFMNPNLVSSRKMGLLGTLTSLLGIYQLWK